MKDYELVKNNGTGIDFKANNLRHATKIAQELLDKSDCGNGWIYEGFSPRKKLFSN